MAVFQRTADEMKRRADERAFKNKRKAAKENANAHREAMLKRQAEELKTVSERVPGVQAEFDEARRRAYAEPDNLELIESYKNATEKLNQANKAVADLKAAHTQERDTFEQRAKQAESSAQDDWDGKSAPAGPDYDESGNDTASGNGEEPGNDTASGNGEEPGNDTEPGNGTESGEPEEPGKISKLQEKGKEALDKVVEDATKLKPELSATFYRDIGAAMTGRPAGNVLDANAATAKAVSKDEQNEAAHRNMEAQQHQQIANRNEYTEAGKIASMQNDAQNRQNIANKEGLSGAAAALQRTTNAPDVQSQQARQDTARSAAAVQREKGDLAQEDATTDAGLAEEFKVRSRDHDTDLNDTKRLSMGEGEGEVETEAETEEPKTEEPKTEEPKTEEPKTEEPKTEEPKTEEPKPAETPQSMPSGNPQHVINALLGSSKGEDLRSGTGSQDKELYDWALSQGVAPIQAGQHKNENDVNSWEAEFISNNGDKGQQVMQQLRQGRVGEGNDASRNFNANEMDQMNQSMQVGSDSRIKNVERDKSLKDIISDMRMKFIKEDWDEGEKLSPKDFLFLLKRAGKFKHNDRDYDAFEDDIDDQSVLDGYAEHIKNYLYTYKPEATQVDSRIDPNEEHIGPMAQDIEQVNPACVKETPEGVKTVDTARLAMMNAGAIADLARQMQTLTDRLKALGV